MSLNLALAICAVVCAIVLARDPQQRLYALAAIAAAGLLALLQLHWVAIRFEQVRLVAWAAIAILGVVLLFRQTTRNGGAAATALLFSSAIPLARLLRLVG